MLKAGDKIKHIRSGQISIITKIGSPTLYCKVISSGDNPVPGVKVGDMQKTSIHLIGKTYELIKENKMKKLTEQEKLQVKNFAKSLVKKTTSKPGQKIIKENNSYTMISALREIADDLLLQTELLIDRQYGQLDHNKFKNEWYKNANEFEKKFKVIIKSLMKAGK